MAKARYKIDRKSSSSKAISFENDALTHYLRDCFSQGFNFDDHESYSDYKMSSTKKGYTNYDRAFYNLGDGATATLKTEIEHGRFTSLELAVSFAEFGKGKWSIDDDSKNAQKKAQEILCNIMANAHKYFRAKNRILANEKGGRK